MGTGHKNNESHSETKTEQALRASELSYRRLFETAQDGILILDAETGRVNDVNPFLIKLLGFSHGEMVGKTVGELSPFKDIVSNQAMLERLQKHGYVRYEDLPLETADGRKVAVEFVSNVYQVGNVKVIQCNIRDITVRKRTEESLRLLSSAVEQSMDSVMITDAELDLPGPRIVFVNPAFTMMTGYSSEEAIGKTPRILHGVRTDKAVLSQLRCDLEQGKTFAGETVNYRKDGTQFDLAWQVVPLRTASEKITHFVATQRDITEHKKLETQFRQAQKMEVIGQLAGGIAHDFNNILTVIQMQCDLLKLDENPSPTQLAYAEEIGTATRRAAALTRQLLLFSRKETLRLRDLDLSQSIEDMTKMLRRILGENIEMQFKFAPQPLCIHADPGMMDQVLMNLAVNSRDGMPNGGQLVIETSAADFDESIPARSIQSRPGSFVCLSVSDTGCGIPPENLARIFEPFFTTKSADKGTGLGLAIVLSIVQQHHGWVNVYSELGHGTTFRIYFPRLAGVSEKMLRQPELPAWRSGGETVLLVEDDAFLRAAAQKTLSRSGYRVFAAVNGTEAVKIWKLNRDKIRLLLTDLVLPGGMSGRELGELLLQEEPKLKVIYTSGHGAEVAAEDLTLTEGVNFIGKPFQAFKLSQTVGRALDSAFN
jgi:two-component system, cell cycle sensor histidine kinase and response regulator CckA